MPTTATYSDFLRYNTVILPTGRVVLQYIYSSAKEEKVMTTAWWWQGRINHYMGITPTPSGENEMGNPLRKIPCRKYPSYKRK